MVRRTITSCSTLLAVLFFFIHTASALNISLNSKKDTFINGENISITIDVNDSVGVAGATFTLLYPNDSLELVAEPVSTEFFQVFYDNSQDADPASIDPWEKNTTAGGKILLSGAYIDPTTGGGKFTGSQTLFTIGFKVRNDATPGAANLTLQATALFNPDAGWGTDINGDGVFDAANDSYDAAPIIVGAVNNTDDAWTTPSLNDDFPVLLQAFPVDPILALTVSADTDGDLMADTWETANGGDLLPGEDPDLDGFANLEEYTAGTDPDDITDPGLLYRLRPGLNAFTLFLEPQTPYDSSTLLTEMDNAIFIEGQTNDGTIERYVAGAPFGGFDIEIGKGYLIMAADDIEWLNKGALINCDNANAIFNSIKGPNLLGFPAAPIGTLISADDLLDIINTNAEDTEAATRIQGWDGSGMQTYDLDGGAAGFGDFDIMPTKGYMLFMKMLNDLDICDAP